MALKVTIERVANGTQQHSSFVRRGTSALNPKEERMTVIIEPANHTLGDAVLWSYIEGTLQVIQNGTLTTGITGIVSGSPLQVCIAQAVIEQIGA